MGKQFNEFFDKGIVDAATERTNANLEAIIDEMSSFAKIQAESEQFPKRRGLVQTLASNDNSESDLKIAQKELGIDGKLFRESYTEDELIKILGE